MTSTNDIEQELEGLSESVLENLAPDERAALAIELLAAGDVGKAEAVKQAAPMKTYEARDLDFSDRVNDHLMMALYAMWELEAGAWKFFYEKVHGRLREMEYDRFPEEERAEEPTPENGFHEQRSMDAAAEFLGNYIAWERYADEQVGVSLEAFLGHPFGGDAEPHLSTILQTANLTGGEYRDAGDVGGWAEGGTITVDGRELTVEKAADWKYTQLVGGDL